MPLLENFSLWKSACTGDPIPGNEMRQWLEDTLDAIRDLHADSILEVGCGHGLLLLRLAGECARYVGVDFSAAALNRLCKALEKLPPEQLENLDVDLCQAEAA
ncbi:class I SAM-dependent methyltransferase, partial [uncultured Desulfovibrio sp.]